MRRFASFTLFLALVACGPGDSPRGDDGNDDTDDTSDEPSDGQESCSGIFPTRCVGTEYQVCTDGVFETVETCNSADECIVDVGCGVCNPSLGNTCSNGDVYQCNGDGSLGGMVEECGTETCANGHCGGGTSSCTAGDFIYLVDIANNLLKFDPRNDAHTFTPIGTLSCGAGTPFSMSVDRQGKAWVLYSTGRIYHVNTTTAACTDSGFVPNQEFGTWSTFGMGFVSESPGSDEERLWISSGGLPPLSFGELGYVDGSMTCQGVGALPEADYSPELTGTGNAELYAYFPGANQFVARLDKTTVAVQQQWDLPSGSSPMGWAFAHWGGRFYIFISPTFGARQTLRLDPVTGETTTVVADMPYTIVGAGVSTCAPVVVE